MAVLRNLLALVGLVVVIGGIYLAGTLGPILSEFDPGFKKTYVAFAQKLLDTKDPGDAMVYKVPVQEGISTDDVKESLKSLATERDFLFVGDAPFYKQVEAVTGKPFRHVSFMSFCDVMVGKMMLEYNPAYTAFMPCRISLVEDEKGNLALYTMALDMMIHGGKELPPELKKEALRVWQVIKDMMQGAAAGEF
ncbi:MAG: DUF302 domain-containing protein [Magnetococcales bacterium]|nr:DUF302 domain-containing protein [Magnetococcales bacterium]